MLEQILIIGCSVTIKIIQGLNAFVGVLEDFLLKIMLQLSELLK
jgi:hypothetical protein